MRPDTYRTTLPLVIGMLCGCVGAIGEGIRTGGQEAVLGASDGLVNLPPGRAREVREALLADVDLERLAHDLARAAVAGASEALTDAESQQRLKALTAALIDATLERFDGRLENLEPQV